MEDELWWQNLEEWIFDDRKPVTFKYVATSLKVPVNDAKKMLFTYHERSKKKTSAILLLAGLIDGGLHIKTVRAEDAAEVESTFDKTLTKHVYALIKPGLNFNLNDVISSSHEEKKDHEAILPLRAIICKHSGEKREVELSPPSPPPPKKESKAMEQPVKEEEKTSIKEEVKDEKVKSNGNEKSQSKKAKPSGKNNAIASMFAKAPPKKEKKVEEVSKEDKSQASSDPKSDSPGKENKSAQEDNLPSKVKDEPVNKKRTASTAPASKRRKRIQVMSSSDSSDNEDEPEPMDMQEEEEEVPETKEEADVKEEIPDTPTTDTKVVNGKRRTKKYMNKTFVDDSGFMVTKKELVSCSEEEDEEPVKPIEKPKSKGETAPRQSTNTETSGPKGPKKQSTIKNFFMKR